jgi:hypothetical protein
VFVEDFVQAALLEASGIWLFRNAQILTLNDLTAMIQDGE